MRAADERRNPSSQATASGRTSSAIPADTVVRKTGCRDGQVGRRHLRAAPASSALAGILLGTALHRRRASASGGFSRAACREERILSYRSLPSPAETFDREQLHRAVVR